jgi:adenylate kinase
MRLLLIAPPGAGKGTQADMLSETFGIEHLSTGELFRREIAQGSDLGRQACTYLNLGDLVPDSLVLAVATEPIKRAAGNGGYVLDGFPRIGTQAVAFDAMASELGGPVLDRVISLEVSRPELIRRVMERAARQGRTDDDRTTLAHRLEVFDRDTQPLLDYYRDNGLLVTINGEQPVDLVSHDILMNLDAVAAGSSGSGGN